MRFAGFADDWEERKLVEISDYRNGKSHEKDISEDGNYIVVNSKFVSTNGLWLRSILMKLLHLCLRMK
ncbi:hypothetical protein ACWN83_09470 [Pseudolactococcus plantarum]|uniref:hypothetical protein n=1 Tax=Pseudolactococcus plantarum TaxID=1365 RepID=UPI0012E8A28A|nr:hypothetical protein [Lactococcus plantarum]